MIDVGSEHIYYYYIPSIPPHSKLTINKIRLWMSRPNMRVIIFFVGVEMEMLGLDRRGWVGVFRVGHHHDEQHIQAGAGHAYWLSGDQLSSRAQPSYPILYRCAWILSSPACNPPCSVIDL
jgi:hypothetical protein